MKILIILLLLFSGSSFASNEHDTHEITNLTVVKDSRFKSPGSTYLSCASKNYEGDFKKALDLSRRHFDVHPNKEDALWAKQILSIYGLKRSPSTKDELLTSFLLRRGLFVAAKMSVAMQKPNDFGRAVSAFLASATMPSDHHERDDPFENDLVAKIERAQKIQTDLGIIYKFPAVRYFALSHVFRDEFAYIASAEALCSLGFSKNVLDQIGKSINESAVK